MKTPALLAILVSCATLADAGEFDRAIAVLREVTTKNPANGQARFFLGVTLVGKAEATRTKSLWDEAIIELQHAIEQNYDPGLASFYIALSLIHI